MLEQRCIQPQGGELETAEENLPRPYSSVLFILMAMCFLLITDKIRATGSWCVLRRTSSAWFDVTLGGVVNMIAYDITVW